MADNKFVLDDDIENRLKAIAYQFVTLYERWAEDRQLAAKQNADTLELVEAFSEQVKNLENLEPAVREQIRFSIQNSVSGAAKKIGEEMGKEATRSTENIAHRLQQTTDKAQQTLGQYQTEVITTQWKVIGISVFTTIVTSLLLVWLILPKPMLPLTDAQFQTYQNGQLFEVVWSKLNKKQQQWLMDLSDGKVKNQNQKIEAMQDTDEANDTMADNGDNTDSSQ